MTDAQQDVVAMAKFKRRVHSLLFQEPVEDGWKHQGEEALREAAAGLGEKADEWCMNLATSLRSSEGVASLLVLFGRTGLPMGREERRNLLRDALASEDIRVRAAGVQAAELWKDPDLRRVLLNHHDPVTWLEDYKHRVSIDLSS